MKLKDLKSVIKCPAGIHDQHDNYLDFSYDLTTEENYKYDDYEVAFIVGVADSEDSWVNIGIRIPSGGAS